MSYRRFSPEAETIARRWFDQPFEQGWTIGERIGLRHATAPHWAEKDDKRAVLKPGPHALIEEFESLTKTFGHSNADYVRTTPVAAIEKIAADLAFVAGLPVPPVALYENKDVQPGMPNRNACLSLRPFAGEIIPARLAVPAMNPSQLSAFIAADSAMSVFKGWMQNTDGNIANILIEKSTGAPAYPDFSVSSLAHWQRGTSPMTKIMADAQIISRHDVRRASEIIMAIPDATVAEVVHRLPSHFLDDDGKDMMADGLTFRKNNLLGLILKNDAATLTADTSDEAAQRAIDRRAKLRQLRPDLEN